MKRLHGKNKKNPSVIMSGMLTLETFSRNLLYEDNHLLAVVKPAGMLIQGDRSGRVSLLDLGKQWLTLTYHKPGRAFLGLLQRLDRPVSGVVLFAKTSKAARRLSEQFRNRTIQKIYLTVIHGHLQPSKGYLIHYLARNGLRSFSSTASDPKAQQAALSYEILKERSQISLARVTLDTGRHHQIRAQLAASGNPILGDRAYGSDVILNGNAIALHALSLTFLHPIIGNPVTLKAPLPKGWPWSTFS